MARIGRLPDAAALRAQTGRVSWSGVRTLVGSVPVTAAAAEGRRDTCSSEQPQRAKVSCGGPRERGIS